MRRVAALIAIVFLVGLMGCSKAKKDSKDYSGEASGKTQAGSSSVAQPSKAVD